MKKNNGSGLDKHSQLHNIAKTHLKVW